MKVVAYNIKDFEKELLAVANGKVHDLTLISNDLNRRTMHYAVGKEVIIISDQDKLDKAMLQELHQIGIRKIITRSILTGHINLKAADLLGIQVANTPYVDQSAKGIAAQTIRNLTFWENDKCVGKACCCLQKCATSKNNKA